MRISACHFPRNTSKCNKFDHWMFCAMVNRSRAVATKEGLTIHSASDKNRSGTGRKVREEEMESPSIERDTFHGEWNYTLTPRPLNDGAVSPRVLMSLSERQRLKRPPTNASSST